MAETIVSGLLGLASVALSALILREQAKSKKAQEDAQKRMEIVLEASEASLIGLKQLGANGRVTTCLNALEAYKNTKAAI
jgi:hypothetical protein